MVYVSLAVSVIALMVSVATFVVARVEYRRTGAVVEVDLAWGHAALHGRMISLHCPDHQATLYRNQDYKHDEWLAKWGLWGVHVRNTGRGSIVVRGVSLPIVFAMSETDEKGLRQLGLQGAKRDGLFDLSSHALSAEDFVVGPKLPYELKGGSDEYWAVSCAPFKDYGRHGAGCFTIQLGTGMTMSTPSFPVVPFESEIATDEHGPDRKTTDGKPDAV